MEHLSSPAPSVFAEFCAAGLWTGVGPALAEQMAAAGITGPAQVTLEALGALPRVTDKRANRLYTAWIGAGGAYEVAELLIPHQIPARWVPRLMEALGDAAATILRGDPWRLLVLPDATVAQADRLGRAIDPSVRPDDPRRARALVDHALARLARDGHTAAPADLVADALRPYGIDTAPAVTAAIGAAVTAGLVTEVPDPTGAGERWIARSALAAAEDAIATHLARLRRTATPLAPAAKARGACTGLDATQTGAVVTAAAQGVSLLTGGPGTGKSRTVAAVVGLCRATRTKIALAAPTGRAAKRLSELVAAGTARTVGAAPAAGDGGDAMTIHRLLGARRGSGATGTLFEHDADDPIDARMVVVDEASMLDVELAAALLAALKDGTHLLIVGDPAQLPSVGPGRVLGDVLESAAFPVTELSTLYRQSEGGAIARLATSVRGGELLPANPADHEVVIVPADGSPTAARRVVQLVTDSIPRVFSVSGEQVQVVTPVHRGPAGTQALNQALKRVLNPGPHPRHRTVRGFDVGDRVVATANYLDAEPTGYANGEVGTVIDTGEKSVRVAFPGGEAEISGKALNDLLHGWAVTVHRAQGSEWEAVVVVLPPEASRMLSRPLVYTALTRARIHLSVVHAAGPMLAHAVRRIGSKPRRTRLATLLRDGANRPGAANANRPATDRAQPAPDGAD